MFRKDIYDSEKRKAKKGLKNSKSALRVKELQVRFYDSLDKNMDNFVKENEIWLDCKNGCSYCCYLRVTVRAREIFLIKDYIINNFTDEEIDATKKALTKAAEKLNHYLE